MNVRRFVERRRPRWERFEQMVELLRNSRSEPLNREELYELGRLYRLVATDLAYARQQGADTQVVDYLNSLLAKAHAVLYRTRRGSPLQGLRTFWYAFPDAVRRHFRLVLVCIGLFLLGAIIPYLMVLADPSWEARLIAPAWSSVLNQWKSGEQRAVGEATGSSLMFSFYFVNNTRVALLAFGLGFFFGIPTVYLMWSNGFLIGLFAGALQNVGKLGFFLVSIYPHGVPELGAIFLCGAGGLILGRAMLMPGDLTRIESVRRAAPDAFWLLAGSMVLLLIAAFTEAFFSFYAFPSWAKFLWGTVALIALSAYIVLVRKPDTNQVH
ncbi:MAG: stage II sporulation protein M [Fimbriimonadales bacterium]